MGTVSNRVVDTPCLLVTSQYGYSANMERIMQSQAFADTKRTQYLVSKKTMEDTKGFANRMYKLFKAGLSLESLDLAPEIEVPEEEEAAEEEDGEEAEVEDDEG